MKPASSLPARRRSGRRDRGRWRLRAAAVCIGGLVALVALAALGRAGAFPAVAAGPDDPPVTVEARVDRNTITVGDRIRLTVVARSAPGFTLQPSQDEDFLGIFEVLERRPGAVQPMLDGGQVLRLEYVVTAFRPGSVVLPGPGVPFVDRDGSSFTAYADDLPVVVQSVLTNDPNPQLFDLKPPLAIPGGANNRLRSVATALLVAAALALAILTLRRLPRRTRVFQVPALYSPQELARRELEAIVADGLLEHAAYALFYRRLALCVRQYLQDRYQLPALSFTSTELGREMVRRGADRWLARVVAGLLEECDAVRWGGYRPADARAKQALDLAFTIVEMDLRAPVGASRP